MLPRPFGHGVTDFGPVEAQERRGGRRPAVPGIVGKNTAQVAVIKGRRPDGVERLLALVVLGERAVDAADRVDEVATAEHRLLAGNLGHQLVDVLEFGQRRPTGVALAPVGAGPSHTAKVSAKSSSGWACAYQHPQALDVVTAGGVGAKISRIAGGGASEQPLPTPPALQPVGGLHHVPRLMAHDALAFAGVAALHVQDVLSFEAEIRSRGWAR